MTSAANDSLLGEFQQRYWRSAPRLPGTPAPLSTENVADDEFRLLADNLPTLCWIANGDGYIVWYNRRWHDYCGTTPAQMEGWGWQSVHDPRTLPAVMERWTESVATGEPFEMTFPLKGADGIFRPFLTRVQPVRDANGEVARWFGVNTEIAAQHAAELALRESEERLRLILDAATDYAIFTIDPARRITSWSEGAAKIFGGSAQQAIGQSADIIFTPEDRAAGEPEKEIATARREGCSNDQRWHLQFDGGRVYMNGSVHRLPNYPDGRERGFIKIARDETERRAIEEAVRESNQRLQQMFNQAPGFMAMLRGPEQVFELANPAYMQLVGHRDIIGKPVREALPEVADQGFLELLDQVYRTGEAFVGSSIEVALQRAPKAPAERRFVDFVYQPITDSHDAVTGIFVEGSDVTERTRAEALRVMQNRVLEATLRNAPLGEVLETLLLSVEAQSQSGMLASILLLEESGQNLRHGAAPSLPKAYNEAIDGIAIGPGVGSCGTAAYCKRPVYVSDIASDSLWNDFRELALSHNLRACWSTPILSGSGDVLGTFAMYYPEPREPTESDLELVELVTRSAALVIERKRAETSLTEESRTLETLNRTGAALAAELDLERLVQMVTDAGVQLTGAQFGAFFYNVLDDAGESYMLYALSGAERSDFDRFGMPRATAIFHPTFMGEGVVRSDDITKDERYGKNDPHRGMPEGHLPVRSYLAVPVISRSGEVIGGLFFGHPHVARFTARHERLITGIAAQAAVGIDNARLYEAAQKELAERIRAETEVRELNETLEQRVREEIQRRAEAEEALRQSQKMETLGQLTGGIAHDFNNLLQIVSGNLDTLTRKMDEDAPLRRYAERATKGAERAATLTQRLLAFSRRQPLAPKPTDVNRLLPGMSELLHRTLGETIEVEAVLPPRVWLVETDPNQLENAILNLAVNARDAMPGGGKLTIETQNTHLDEKYALQNPGVTPGQYVVICISDTGVGMDADTAARAIEPFFTTKEVGKGTGLGLSMVYGFIKQSSGHLKIYSEPGQGTTVKIYLPRLISRAAAIVEDEPLEAPAGRGQETILVCEDDEDVRAYSVEVLRELGYRVLEATDGPAALAILRNEGSNVDLLFTDVVLPAGMSGAVLAKEAAAIRPGLKTLFTTGYARNAIVHHGRLDPGVQLLTKPFSYADLAARIREMLDQGCRT
jgi:PAS domain S-box-containing protein